jgi:glutamate carboxypeptidase
MTPACYARLVSKSSEALEWLTDDRRSEIERDLRALVEINSHTPDREGNDAVARALDALLARLCPSGALQIERRPSARFGEHLIATTRATGPRVLLIGHHDTVFPASKFSGFNEEGALLRGPGVLDMKGGLTVIAYALSALDRAGMLATMPLAFVSVSDEEVGSPEGRGILLSLCREARAALVFESGRAADKIITRRKGTGAVNITARGKAAHAGNNHQDGVNALWALSVFVDRAQKLTDYDRGVTVNVGRVEGGIGKNTVPDAATAELDLRYVTSEDGDALVSSLREACRHAELAVPGSAVQLSGGLSRRPLERTAATGELLAVYAEAARAEGLGSEEAALLGGGSDANTVAEAGVPAIDGLGPRGKGFHTVDEQVERATLVPKTRALVRALLALTAA